jgi:hypothetical protein
MTAAGRWSTSGGREVVPDTRSGPLPEGRVDGVRDGGWIRLGAVASVAEHGPGQTAPKGAEAASGGVIKVSRLRRLAYRSRENPCSRRAGTDEMV